MHDKTQVIREIMTTVLLLVLTRGRISQAVADEKSDTSVLVDGATPGEISAAVSAAKGGHSVKPERPPAK